MSYEIIYDKQFIKVEDKGVEKFCPIILTGSNNCYENNGGTRDRRARGWWNFTWITEGKGFATKEEMLKKADEERAKKIADIEARNKRNDEEGRSEWNDEYSDKSWGYFTGMYINGNRSTSFGQYRGIFKTGCEKAITVEQLKEFYGSVTVCVSYYDRKELEAIGKEAKSFNVTTSQELVEKYYELEEYLKDTKFSPRIELSLSERQPKYIRQRLFAREKKQHKTLIEVDHYFVVKDFSLDNYVVKSKRNGYSYSRYGKSYAKQFRLEREAKAYAKRLDKKYNQVGRFVVEPVEESTRLYI
jgi:hypothetical protein